MVTYNNIFMLLLYLSSSSINTPYLRTHKSQTDAKRPLTAKSTGTTSMVQFSRTRAACTKPMPIAMNIIAGPFWFPIHPGTGSSYDPTTIYKIKIIIPQISTFSTFMGYNSWTSRPRYSKHLCTLPGEEFNGFPSILVMFYHRRVVSYEDNTLSYFFPPPNEKLAILPCARQYNCTA